MNPKLGLAGLVLLAGCATTQPVVKPEAGCLLEKQMVAVHKEMPAAMLMQVYKCGDTEKTERYMLENYEHRENFVIMYFGKEVVKDEETRTQ